MTQLAAHHDHHGHGGIANHPALRSDNINFPAGSGKLGVVLLGVGAVAVAASVGLAKAHFAGAWGRQAIAAYHVATTAVLAVCLAGTIFTMVFSLVNSGWTAALRRQFENIVSFLPFAYLMVLATVLADVFVLKGTLFFWLNPHFHSDQLLLEKWAYFFAPASRPTPETEGHFVAPVFFLVRAALYGVIWTTLSRRLITLSKEQDRTGDASITLKLRFTSAWGVLVMALTTAFAAFDWLMSLDFRFFSTMWGVYYFAGGSFAFWATVGLVFAVLRSRGKLEGAVTSEHFHDIGKFMFGFTVFWGYIAFSQYFLIWYSNIPEETSYYIFRKYSAWGPLTAFLVLGHFAVPFLFFLSRHIKKHPMVFALGAIWALMAHLADIFWIVRPMTYTTAEPNQVPAMGAVVIDVLAIGGVVLIFAGYLIKRITGGPLIPVNDPWLAESLDHKNYV